MTVLTRAQTKYLNNEKQVTHQVRSRSKIDLEQSTKLTDSHLQNEEIHRKKVVPHTDAAQEKKDCELGSKKFSMLSVKASVSDEKASTRNSFGGPCANFFLIFWLPLFVILLNEVCTADNCQLRWISLPRDVNHYWNKESMLIVLSWILFQAIIYMSPLGVKVYGLPLGNGQRLAYRCNGFHALVISAGAIFLLKFYFKLRLDFVLHNWTAMMTSAMLCALILSCFLFIKSYWAKNENLSEEGNTGHWFCDFFMGRELNPRVGSFDLKFFCEFRPGLITWVMFNLILCIEQYEKESSAESNYALFMVTFFQFCYVADALWYEDCILSTIDIIQEGFGFMLAFGDLVFVPFMFTLTTRFLFLNPTTLPSYWLILAFILNFVGFVIFRQANGEKHMFRCDPESPSFAHLKTIPTQSGKKILCDGWWAFVRHPNYFGDLLMAVAWSLPCGFNMAVPWFYPVYLTSLLSHRALRDGECNRRKYGAAWNQYCQQVPYRIFPRVF